MINSSYPVQYLTMISMVHLNTRAPSTGNIIFTDVKTIASSILALIVNIFYIIFVIPTIVVLALSYYIYPLSDDLRKFGLLGPCILLRRFDIYCITIPQYPSATHWKVFCHMKGYPAWSDRRR
ncbi:hypothetical protein BDP27DRAFT_301993 [Rhodocollybia butyracea]|uniref:Uncharacterized protein n=1 Tax=Rhodocollybia butyracea TaxID=206335 RepID=A0A9P5Q4I0_9AGAR|nr:hypothetical protein BDP27DRAFT_301993 [Rhodocollybia butyracea]